MLIAALARALVDTEARGWRQGTAPLRWRGELLRLAAWRASRSGLSDVLLSPLTGIPEPAAAVAATLFGHVSGALAVTGDTATVRELLTAVLARGNGAAFQRNAYRQSQGLPSVIQSATAATMR